MAPSRSLDRTLERGAAVARILSGAWRDPAPSLSPDSSDLSDETATLIARAGAAGLLWWRLQAGECSAPVVDGLRQTYRLQVLEEAVHRRDIEATFAAFSAAGRAPILIKGWSIARRYPAVGLRPFCDLDLLHQPGEQAAILAALRHASSATHHDLHDRIPGGADRDRAELLRRTRRQPLGQTVVRLLGAEDELRLLALHMLTHGVCRMIWLCDIAVAIERRDKGFDWDYLLAGRPRDAEAVACAVGLAHRLLGARIDDTPISEHARRLPNWVASSVLREWGSGYEPPNPLGRLPRWPREFIAMARARWSNPIRATEALGARYDRMPRLPLQLADYALRTARYLARR